MIARRFYPLLQLSLPMIIGMFSQSLFTLVDTAMVGRLGETALAGVGLGSYINFVLVASVMGLSSAVQALVARRQGAQNSTHCAEPVNAGIIVAVGIVLPISVLLLPLAHALLPLFHQDTAVIRIGSDYYQWRIIALPAVAMNVSFRGYWNGIRKPRNFLCILLIMQILNAFISYGLIFGAWGLPALGAKGSAIGTSLALYIGCALHWGFTYKEARKHGFLRNFPAKRTWQALCRLAIPNSCQQVFFAIGLFCLFWIIAQMNTLDIAVAHILIHIGLLLILPGVGLGMALGTIVSHHLGAEKECDAYQAGKDAVILAFGILFCLGIPLWLYPHSILVLFTNDPLVIERGLWPLRIQGIGLCLDAASLVLAQALLSAGASRTVMKVKLISQWALYLPLAWVVGPLLGFGLVGIWLLQITQRLGNSLVFLTIWSYRRWGKIRL